MDRSEFVATSIAKKMTARLRATHTKRGISIFSGPPGIGKTTAIEAFAAEHPLQVAIVKVNRAKATDRVTMMHAHEAVLRLSGRDDFLGSAANNSYQAKSRLFDAIYQWALDHVDTRDRQGDDWLKLAPPLTLVFDEAQNLAREAIEALRYWNDRDRCYGPVPVGLVFVGNSEFSLQTNWRGQSVISAAVADRLQFSENYDYADLTNADLGLFLRAHGVDDDQAVFAIVRHFGTARVPRSLRAVLRLIERLRDEAGEAPVTMETVRAAALG